MKENSPHNHTKDQTPSEPTLDPFFDHSIATTDPQLMTSYLSPAGLSLLYLHLANGCVDYSTESRTGSKVRKVVNIRTPMLTSIAQSVNSTTGRLRPQEGQLAFVPHCLRHWNPGQSRWAGIRIKGRDNADATEKSVKEAAQMLRTYGPHRSSLLEDTRDGGWQLWAIADCFVAIRRWLPTLELLTLALAGKCDFETFPDPTHPDHRFGRGMRAPGSWNPYTLTPARVVYQDLEKLMPHIYPRFSGAQRENLIRSGSSLRGKDFATIDVSECAPHQSISQNTTINLPR